MKKKALIGLTLLLLSVGFACQKEELSPVSSGKITKESTRQADDEVLKQLSVEITTLANSVSCTDGSQWKTTGIGTKPCGGPNGYIAYHNSINEKAFLEKVAEHAAQNKLYNEKHQLVSNCMVEAAPKGVKCENNKAVLVY